jgi:hypothetical protein
MMYFRAAARGVADAHAVADRIVRVGDVRGQLTLVPRQLSAGSHVPLDERHGVPTAASAFKDRPPRSRAAFRHVADARRGAATPFLRRRTCWRDTPRRFPCTSPPRRRFRPTRGTSCRRRTNPSAGQERRAAGAALRRVAGPRGAATRRPRGHESVGRTRDARSVAGLRRVADPRRPATRGPRDRNHVRGQAAASPVQLSATSQMSADARHPVPPVTKRSPGTSATRRRSSRPHRNPPPRHGTSSRRRGRRRPGRVPTSRRTSRRHRSSPPTDGHSVPTLAKWSSGHTPEAPSQVSGTSQPPEAARHSVPAVANPRRDRRRRHRCSSPPRRRRR